MAGGLFDFQTNLTGQTGFNIFGQQFNPTVHNPAMFNFGPPAVSTGDTMGGFIQGLSAARGGDIGNIGSAATTAPTPIGFNTQTMGAIGQLGQGLAGLGSAYLGFKNLKLAREQFGFQKGLANRNIANQAKTINNAYDNAARMSAALMGGQGGMADPALREQYLREAQKSHVDASPIG